MWKEVLALENPLDCLLGSEVKPPLVPLHIVGIGAAIVSRRLAS